jgi:hypothetical protein
VVNSDYKITKVIKIELHVYCNSFTSKTVYHISICCGGAHRVSMGCSYVDDLLSMLGLLSAHSRHSTRLCNARTYNGSISGGTALGFVMREPTMGASPAAQYTIREMLTPRVISVIRPGSQSAKCLLNVIGHLPLAAP